MGLIHGVLLSISIVFSLTVACLLIYEYITKKNIDVIVYAILLLVATASSAVVSVSLLIEQL